MSVERPGQPLARRPGKARLGSVRGEPWRMECQGRSLELGPGKDGAHGKLARPPQGSSWNWRP